LANETLFDEKTRRKLEQLMLQASRVRAGAIKGERRSVKRGTSIEFADYRNYVPGDDLRRLDWNIYARLDRPLTKLYEDEEDLAVHLILDASESMDWPREGEGDLNKFDYARRLVAGLGFTSLASNDRLLVLAASDRVAETFGPARGRGFSVGLLRFMTGLKTGGATDLNRTLEEYALRGGRAGLLIVVSDLFTPEGIQRGLNALLAKGYEIAVVHVLSPDEIEPPLAGDLRLVDIETNMPQEVSIDDTMRELYVRRVNAWRDDLRADFLKRGVHYFPVVTSTPWEKVILHDLRRGGLLK